MSITNATVTVTNSATLIHTGTGSPPIKGERGAGILVQNNHSAVLYVGGPTVTADEAATGGVQIPADGTLPLGDLAADDKLYGIFAAGSGPVAVLRASA